MEEVWLEGNLSEIRIIFWYLKKYRFRDFMNNFHEMAEIWQFSAVWKLLKYEHIIYNFETCDQEI